MALFSSSSATSPQLDPADDSPTASYKPALTAMATLYFLMGFITCLNDTLVPYFKKGFELSYAQSSLIQFYFFLTYGLMSIPAGKLVRRIGYKKGVVCGFAIAAVGAFLFYPASLMHQYAVFLGALFIIAIGIVLLQVAANPYITALGPQRSASSRLSMIQGIGSIGTTVAPLFGSLVILTYVHDKADSSQAVVLPYVGIGLVLLLTAVLVSRLRLPTLQTPAAQHKEWSIGQLWSVSHLRLGVIALFCYVGAEVAIGTFLTNYVADKLAIPESQANAYVALYWGSMFVGRLIGAYILRYFKAQHVLMLLCVAAIFSILLSLFTTGLLSAYAMVAVGLCNAMMFAIIFSLSVFNLGASTSTASGILSSAIVGGAIISYLQGLLIDEFNWTVAFMAPLLCYFFILYYSYAGYKAHTFAVSSSAQ